LGELDRLNLEPTDAQYESASKHSINVMRQFQRVANIPDKASGQMLNFVVTEIPQLNLLGRDTIQRLQISIDDKMKIPCTSSPSSNPVNTVFQDLKPD